MTAYRLCPNCRGYNLERQWCQTCKTLGYLEDKDAAPRDPANRGTRIVRPTHYLSPGQPLHRGTIHAAITDLHLTAGDVVWVACPEQGVDLLPYQVDPAEVAVARATETSLDRQAEYEARIGAETLAASTCDPAFEEMSQRVIDACMTQASQDADLQSSLSGCIDLSPSSD